MTFEEIRKLYQPYNDDPNADCVKLTFEANFGYVDTKTVQDAVTDLEHKVMLVSVGLHEFSPLESLGIMLLLDRVNSDRRTKDGTGRTEQHTD